MNVTKTAAANETQVLSSNRKRTGAHEQSLQTLNQAETRQGNPNPRKNEALCKHLHKPEIKQI